MVKSIMHDMRLHHALRITQSSLRLWQPSTKFQIYSACANLKITCMVFTSFLVRGRGLSYTSAGVRLFHNNYGWDAGLGEKRVFPFDGTKCQTKVTGERVPITKGLTSWEKLALQVEVYYYATGLRQDASPSLLQNYPEFSCMVFTSFLVRGLGLSYTSSVLWITTRG